MPHVVGAGIEAAAKLVRGGHRGPPKVATCMDAGGGHATTVPGQGEQLQELTTGSCDAWWRASWSSDGKEIRKR